MHFSLSSLLRLIAFTALGASALAIGLARAVPREPQGRRPSVPRHVGINGVSFWPPHAHDYLLDTETGLVRESDFAGGLRVDFASSAPWRDPGGRVPLIGRSLSQTGPDGERVCAGAGLTVVDLKDGEVLDHSEAGPIVTGRPCWLPGPSSRVLFPAGDGRLHVVDLPDPDGPDAARDGRPAAPLAWDCPVPGDGPVILSDPVCPPVPELGGRVFVTLTPLRKARDRTRYQPSEIWCLRLDPDARSIVEANRLTRATADGTHLDERLPNLARTPDGRLVVAYLSREKGARVWDLKLAPVVNDPAARVEGQVTLAADLAVTLPAFSPDGRWVYAVSRLSPTSPSVSRIDVAEALQATSPGRAEFAGRYAPARP